MKHLTVKDLKKLCDEQIRKGNGDKKILISDDDEGNGFHSLFFPFTDNTEDVKMLLDSTFHEYYGDTPEELVILG